MDPFLSATIENLSEYFVANSRTSLTDFMDSANNSGSSTNNIMNSPIFDSLDNSSDGGSSGLNTTANKQSSNRLHLEQPALDQLPSNSNHDIDQFDLGCNNLINNTSNTSSNHTHHHHSTTSNPINNHSTRNASSYIRHTAATTTTTPSTSSRNQFSRSNRTQVPIYCQIEQFDSCPNSSSVAANYYQPILNDNDLFRTTDNLEDTFKKPLYHHHQQQQPHSALSNHADGHVPHLHQSKLALESVTNCNGSTSTSGLLEPPPQQHPQKPQQQPLQQPQPQQIQQRPPPPLPSIPTHQLDALDDGCGDPLDDHDVKPRALDDFEGLDVSFDQIGDHDGSTSPLSMHQESSGLGKIKDEDLQQISILNSSNNDSINHNQDNYQQQLSSSKEAYVLVQTSTAWLDLVRTVLTQLGYSGLDVVNSKATLIIRNWKPLPLDQVADDKKATVGEVLSELHGFVTLKISIVNSALSQAPTEWTETMIRQIVTTLCQSMSQLTLSKLCNISQPLISAIVRGGKRLGRRKCEEFGQWYLNYIKSMDARPVPGAVQTESTVARLVFDKTREIPQLKAWFAESTKPSEEMLECYSKILNEERKYKPQVSAKALKNWWKNERQKLGIRQRENRGRPRLKRID